MNLALQYFNRLLPANPILRRVVESAGKRKRDVLIRCGYLGLLVLLVCLSLLSASNGIGSLESLAKASRDIFKSLSVLQLGLVALLAPVLTAGAITQEKDSQTYDILLATPLTNAQIVVGTLASRLFFIIALLVSGIPVFAVTQIFGGVAIDSIVRSFGIAAATAIVTGALAMAIATFKVGTRRTIFSFYLFIAVYIIGGYLLDPWSALHPKLTVAGTVTSAQTSWITGIHPFLALQTLSDRSYTPPKISELPPGLRTWPVSTWLTDPTSFYIDGMLLLSVLLVLPSMVLLRRMAQSTLSPRAWILQKMHIKHADQTKKPRYVWANPIAWREAKTKASAARAVVLRYGFTAIGLGSAIVLVVLYASPAAQPAQAITDSSYNSALNTLFIHGDTTYGVAPEARFYLDDKEVNQQILHGNYAVKSSASRLINGTKMLTQVNLSPIPHRMNGPQVRQLLLGLTVLEFSVILLIVTNAAASAVTREKEDGSLDLLLSTPITSRYYLWGKLRGLVSFVLPLVAVPVGSVLIFVVYDICRLIGGAGATGELFEWIAFPESLVLLPTMIVIVIAFASIVGIQMSLRCRTTVGAVMSSVAIVLGICGLLIGCGSASLSTHGGGDVPSLIVPSFSPFTMISLLIDPYRYDLTTYGSGTGDDVISARITVTICALIAIAVYAMIVWGMYNSMVKNFDMTIRRQQR